MKFKELFTESESIRVGKNKDEYVYKVIKTRKGSKYETSYWSIIFTPKDKSKEIVAFRDVFWYHSKSNGAYGLAKEGYTDGNDNGNDSKSMSTPYIYPSDSYLDMLGEIINGTYYSKSTVKEFEDKFIINRFPPKTKASEIKSQLS